MANLETIDVNNKDARLTITPSRVTLKFPNSFSQDEKDKLIEFSLEINKTMEPITKSWRGRFKHYGITLWTDSNKQSKQFKFDNND